MKFLYILIFVYTLHTYSLPSRAHSLNETSYCNPMFRQFSISDDGNYLMGGHLSRKGNALMYSIYGQATGIGGADIAEHDEFLFSINGKNYTGKVDASNMINIYDQNHNLKNSFSYALVRSGFEKLSGNVTDFSIRFEKYPFIKNDFIYFIAEADELNYVIEVNYKSGIVINYYEIPDFVDFQTPDYIHYNYINLKNGVVYYTADLNNLKKHYKYDQEMSAYSYNYKSKEINIIKMYKAPYSGVILSEDENSFYLYTKEKNAKIIKVNKKNKTSEDFIVFGNYMPNVYQILINRESGTPVGYFSINKNNIIEFYSIDSGFSVMAKKLNAYLQKNGTIHAEIMTSNYDGSSLLIEVVNKNGDIVRKKINKNPNLDYVLSNCSGKNVNTEYRHIKSKDGMDIPAYTRIPKPPSAAPIIYLHGGPMRREEPNNTFNDRELAMRGHPVIAVNYRGSEGFGAEFAAAGWGELSGKMVDDVEAAVEWIVSNNLGKRGEIVLLGGSFGGQLALQTAIRNPEWYHSIIIFAPSFNIKAHYWRRKIYNDNYINLNYAINFGENSLFPLSEIIKNEIKNPGSFPKILIVHGEDDDIVNIREAEYFYNTINGIVKKSKLIKLKGVGHAMSLNLPLESPASFNVDEIESFLSE